MSADNRIALVNIKAIDTTKALKRDDHGYYKVILGEFNNYSLNHSFYLVNGVDEILTNKDRFSTARKLGKGALYGEMGHPNMQPGMTPSSFLQRNLNIDFQNTSHHIREVNLVTTNQPSPLPGVGNIIRVEGWIKPSGPKGEFLEKSLNNPHENTAFSIRALHKFIDYGGQKVKQLINIITWDWVDEPGIQAANKWDTVSLESKHVCYIDEVMIQDIMLDKSMTLEADTTSIMKETLTEIRSTRDNFLRRW